MASEEVKKKWGTIFMGNREASVEQLNAMQEPLLREQRQKEQAEDYMERVRARAADRAREILGAAYAERQKVLDEARQEANEQKKKILKECGQLHAEAENARKLAQRELDNAEAQNREAEAIRQAAHAEGYQAGMDNAGKELQEFRLELGQALGSLMHALEWQQQEILRTWREDLVTLVQCAAQAGAGYVLKKEHETILKGLVFQALDLLESRRAISIRVNPADEAQVAELFRAARDRYPELGQWIVTGDEKIEKGGLIAESGSGSVDLKRENFRQMVDGILTHLGLPEGVNEAHYEEMIREIVEREASRIASLTPELDLPRAEPVEQENILQATVQPDPEAAPVDSSHEDETIEFPDATEIAPEGEDAFPDSEVEQGTFMPEASVQEEVELMPENSPLEETPVPPQDHPPADPSLADLEEELFPLEEELSQETEKPEKAATTPQVNQEALELEPETLAGGGFL